MTLIDTSSWIEYYREKGNVDYKNEIITYLKNNMAAVCGIIKIELLMHTKTKKEYRPVESDLSGIHFLTWIYTVGLVRFSHKLSSVKSHCPGKKNLFNLPKNTLRFKKSAKTRCYKGNYKCHKRIVNLILTSMLLVRKPG